MLREIWYFICSPCRPRKKKTVRFAFSLAVIAALFASAAAVISDQESFITLAVTPTNIQEGERFTLSVYATAHTPVNAVDITITYPQSQMDVKGIDTGKSVLTLWTEEPYAKDGTIYLRGGTFQKGFLGEHLIATVRMIATESGTAQVTKNSATFIAGDGLGTEVQVADSDSDSHKIYIKNADGSLVGEASVYIVTDIDGDGKVGLNDVSSFMSAWVGRGETFDFNGDGRMTFKDFSIILADSFFK